MKRTNRTWESLDDAPEAFSGECPVEPRTWERPYAFRRRGRWTSMLPAQTRHYESAVRRWMRSAYGWARPMDGCLRLEAEFATRRPTTRPRREVYAPTKPDIDNFARSFLEALDFKSEAAGGRRLGVISQGTPIVAMSLTKRWAERDEWGGTRFSITGDGDGGVAFTDLLLDAPTARSDGGAGVLTRVGRTEFDRLPDAPDCYAVRLPFTPVPWKDPILYGNRLGTPSEVQAYAARVRSRAASDYGLRKPMDGPLLLEVEVVLGDGGHDRRSLSQWLVLVDYAKVLMDSLDYRRRTADGHALGVLAQDSRVVALTASMRPCESGEKPCVRLAVSPCLGEADVMPLFDHIETGRIL